MTVLLVDLRGRAGEAAMDRIRQVLPDRVLTAPARLLVLDDTTAIVDRYALFTRLFTSRRVASLICVAVGPAERRRAGSVLPASAVLDNDDSATLWVGDEHGVLWGSDQSARHGQPAAGDPGHDAGDGLDQLVRCLSTTSVFDEVLTKVGTVPSRTACPGLRVATGRLAGSDLRQARTGAVRLLVGRAPEHAVEHLPGVDESELAPLLGDGGSVGGLPTPIRPGGKLDQLRQEAETAVQTAERRIRRLRGLGGLLFGSGRGSAVWPWLGYTTQCIEDYHQAAVEALEDGDAGGRIDARQRAKLEGLGLDITPPRGLDRGTVLGRLQGMVDVALGRYPLHTVVDWLRVLSERAAPTGSADARDRLEQLRRTALGGGFVDPPPFPLAVADPRALPLVAVCSLLAAVGTTWGLLSGVGLAVLWLLAAWFTAARVPTPSGNRGALGGLRPQLLLHAVAAALGVAGGRAVADLVALPPAAGIAALCVGAAGLLVTLHLWWDAAAARWTAQLRMDGATAGVAGYEGLLSEVAVREWILADARSYLADAARVVAGGLDDAAGVLDEYGAQQAAKRTGPGAVTTGTMMPESADALETLLAGDLGDAVRATLQLCWDRLRSGALGQSRDGLADEMRALLVAYEEHLARHSVFEPPPFVSAARSGDREVDVMLGPPSRLVDLLVAEPGEAFVQLCAADDLGLLDATPQAARMVRFAPQFVREPVTAAANGAAVRLGDVQWTAAGQLAGVLRLMPMRPGVVVREWASSTASEERESEELA